MLRHAGALLLALTLTACGAGSDESSEPNAGETSAASSPAPTPTPSATPTPTPTPTTAIKTALEVTWGCDGATYSTMEEAWVGGHTNCIDTIARGVPNRREVAAVRAAYGGSKPVKARDVEILYGICGENFNGWPKLDKDPLSLEAAKEVKGAVMLCPTRPGAENVPAVLRESGERAEKERNRMQEGTYLVGAEVNPGTYVATPSGGGCYWERTDRNGDIIDNNFTNGARVQFTIASTDHSVSVQGCGDWKRLN